MLDLGAVCPSSSETGLDWTGLSIALRCTPFFPLHYGGMGIGVGEAVWNWFPPPFFYATKIPFFLFKVADLFEMEMAKKEI